MNKPSPRICMFGTYDRNYTSNKLVIQGLQENHIPLLELNAHTPVTRLDNPREMSWVKLLGRILRKYKIFIEIAKRFNQLQSVNAIYVGYPGHFDVLVAYPIAKLLHKKLVFNPLLIFYTGFTEEQGILRKNSLLAKILRAGESLVYNLCDVVFADTPFQKDYLMKVFNVPEKKIRVLPIGADDRYYRYTPYTNKTKTINVVYYGLYSPIHGVEHIIEAANMLRDKKDITFTFVGNGNTFKENFERAKTLGLKNVTFHYDVPVEKHPAIIQKTDIFFGFLQNHPTVDRVIPNKIYQGLALGKTIITADAPVIRSVFTDKKNVYLCKPSDPKDLARAILDLQVHPALRMTIAENGYALYRKKFTPRVLGKRLAEYVNEVL